MRVGWSEDGRSAYLYDEGNNVVGRWHQGRPDISTFDPFSYGYGQGQAAQGGSIYDVWSQGGGGGGGYGDPGGYYQDPDRLAWDEFVRQFNLTHEEAVAAREQLQRQHDDRMAEEARRLAAEIAMERERMQHETGLERLRSELRIQELGVQHQYAVEYLQLDWAQRHKEVDKQLAMRLREIQGQERMAAAETWWRPIDYGAYAKWAAGEHAATTESGLPVGAPEWQTGLPAEAVGAGGVPTGDPYGQKIAAGGRIQEFGAWGGPKTPVMGTPWTSPHKVNVSQFANVPYDMREMAYGRWRHRGISKEMAQQSMYAAAPVGTAPAQVRYG